MILVESAPDSLQPEPRIPDTGLYCKNASYLLYIWACIQSVMAIESPGGDDDRQWLSFWIIFLLFNVFEAMTDVLLSWLPSYFEMKFVFLCWLVFFQGADVLYRKVRIGRAGTRANSSVLRLLHALPRMLPVRRKTQTPWSPNPKP